MNSISEKLEFVNMTAEERELECVATEAEMKWNDAKLINPTAVRDYFVHIGHVDHNGVKRGFISIAHWMGNSWEIFNMIDQDRIPHITHWIEWFPKTPDGYVQEE